jgi:hypothetical protein
VPKRCLGVAFSNTAKNKGTQKSEKKNKETQKAKSKKKNKETQKTKQKEKPVLLYPWRTVP